MSIIENYVELKLNFETCMKFDRIWNEQRTWDDPLTKQPKKGGVLVLHVYERNGKPVDMTYSTISRKHSAELVHMLEMGTLLNRPICIMKTGSGFKTRYSVRIGEGT